MWMGSTGRRILPDGRRRSAGNGPQRLGDELEIARGQVAEQGASVGTSHRSGRTGSELHADDRQELGTTGILGCERDL